MCVCEDIQSAGMAQKVDKNSSENKKEKKSREEWDNEKKGLHVARDCIVSIDPPPPPPRPCAIDGLL